MLAELELADEEPKENHLGVFLYNMAVSLVS
jgi:hypothetical protein